MTNTQHAPSSEEAARPPAACDNSGIVVTMTDTLLWEWDEFVRDAVEPVVAALTGLPACAVFLQGAAVFPFRAQGCPPTDDKRKRAVGCDPLAVVAPRDVDVRGRRETALARWMPDAVSGVQLSTLRHAIALFDVHVEDRPSSLLIPVAV